VIVTRSGYTGEVGYELFTYEDIAVDLWHELADAWRTSMGCRAGSHLGTCSGWRWATRSTGRICSSPPRRWRRDSDGLSRWTRGISAAERRSCGSSARDSRAGSAVYGCTNGGISRAPTTRVFDGDLVIGEVTSGTFSPLLETGIGLAYLWPAEVADVGAEVEVDIRGRRGAATVVRPPFVDRSPR
jgi:Glycine cleavage system T protein (aminomethyltransferase)